MINNNDVVLNTANTIKRFFFIAIASVPFLQLDIIVLREEVLHPPIQVLCFTTMTDSCISSLLLLVYEYRQCDTNDRKHTSDN